MDKTEEAAAVPVFRPLTAAEIATLREGRREEWQAMLAHHQQVFPPRTAIPTALVYVSWLKYQELCLFTTGVLPDERPED